MKTQRHFIPRLLAPTAVEEMKSEDWDLILFSCTVGGRARVTVRCR